MAEITDPVALAFVDNHLRPLTESLRALEAQIGDAEDAWFNGVNAILAGANTVGNRTRDGAPVLTGDECTSIVAALIAVRDVVTETPGRGPLIEKATIRRLEVSR